MDDLHQEISNLEQNKDVIPDDCENNETSDTIKEQENNTLQSTKIKHSWGVGISVNKFRNNMKKKLIDLKQDTITTEMLCNSPLQSCKTMKSKRRFSFSKSNNQINTVFSELRTTLHGLKGVLPNVRFE